MTFSHRQGLPRPYRPTADSSSLRCLVSSMPRLFDAWPRRLLPVGAGQNDVEARALALRARDRDGPVHRLDEALHDGEAEAGPVVVAVEPVVLLRERLEQLREVVLL